MQDFLDIVKGDYMAEKDYLRPVMNSLGKLVPTNRALLNFINSKARGSGLDQSFHKVKFLNKSEKSTYTCMQVELMQFRQQLQGQGMPEGEIENLVQKASDIFDKAKHDVERVYGEVRLYLITSEIRRKCIESHFRPIPSLSEKQNELIAKEAFTLAYEENLHSEEHNIEDILEGFRRINHIAVQLFAAAESVK